MKFLANIAYHHHPNRVENLTKVIEAIKSYPVQAEIFVDTNDPQAAHEYKHGTPLGTDEQAPPQDCRGVPAL